MKDTLDWWNYCSRANSTNSHRQIFGSLPRNMDEEDMVEPNVSALDILKAQHACKAAARHQAEEDKSSETESKSSETESESESEKPLLLPDFFDDADPNLPLCFKDVIRNTQPSTPWPQSPLAPTSAAGEANQNLPPALERRHNEHSALHCLASESSCLNFSCCW